MGFYKAIFTGAKNLIQNKPKRKNMTQEEKAKRRANIKARLKKVGDKVRSGELQKVSTVATRYAQGKPVVLKKSITDEEKSGIPKEVIIFGVPVPTPVLVLGTIGIIYGISKISKSRARA